MLSGAWGLFPLLNAAILPGLALCNYVEVRHVPGHQALF